MSSTTHMMLTIRKIGTPHFYLMLIHEKTLIEIFDANS